MRRVVLLALLALALPTAALASSLDFSVSTGEITHGTIDASFTTPFSVSVTGDDATIALSGVTITSSPCGNMCHFTGGDVTVDANGMMFTFALSHGTIRKNGNGVGTFIDEITASLLPGNGVTSGNVMFENLHVSGPNTLHPGVFGSQATIDVEGTTIPEPSTLGLLATGLVGLAGSAKRKLKVGR